jgi:hypothetical protein
MSVIAITPAQSDDPQVDDLATGRVLFRAHDNLRSVENLLELEAQDPRVADLYRRVKALRKDLAARLVDVALTPARITEEV